MFSKPFAYLLWLFSGFGWLGLHRFYLRKPFTGILWALTGGLGGFGSVYDLLTLGSQVDRANMELLLFNRAGQYGGTRYADDANAHIVRDTASVERAALRVAKANRGAVTAPELALEAGVEIDAAKKILEGLARKGHAEMRVRRNGTLVFIISEFSEDEDGYADI
ncbi:MAG: TM2 domain-containing protein [Spirochaetaceae bacterium]|jgi:TM2 domain-containing membrane protein YozV|nr:TM2 domain-containing protein [Spirochaetaceae bacterium]